MSDASSTAHKKEINCSNCGAPVEYIEGESVLSCGYCGTSSMLAGFDKIVRVEAHYVLAARKQKPEIRAGIAEWMKTGWLKAADLADEASFSQFDGIVLPFWVVKARAQTFWSGKNRRTRTTGSGDNKRTETYWEPTSGEFSEEYNWSVYARENLEEYWGLNAMNPGSKSVQADWGKFFLGFGMGSKGSGKSNLLEGKEKFDLSLIKEMEIVNGQITQERAELQGRNDMITLHRRLAGKKATQITDCDTTVDIVGVDLVYVPLWEVAYNYKGKPYRILANGHTGDVITG
jgi:DNA-directed RNA polymerase subunit RPC12/RpoP